MYPNEEKPYAGSFIKSHVEISRRKGTECLVVANRDSRRGLFSTLRKYALLTARVLTASVSRDFDVVHAHTTFFAGIIALFAASIRRVPLIITVHGIDDVAWFPGKSSLYKWFKNKWLARTCLRRADHIIVVSNYLRRLLTMEMRIRDQKISVIDMGVNTNMFRPTGKEEARRQLNLPLSDGIVLYVGNLYPLKGCQYLIQAMALIKRPDRRLMMVGEGPERRHLEVLSDSLGLPVTFVGAVPREEVPLWMSAADLLVHPTLSEGFGLVVLEALSCGLPVVASNTGGIPEQINDGVNGYLVEPADVSALAESINRCLEERVDLSTRSRQTALQHNVNLQADRVLAIYKMVVEHAISKEV
jgi:glycosyltransferase involved in cell wall biosynthesis